MSAGAWSPPDSPGAPAVLKFTRRYSCATASGSPIVAMSPSCSNIARWQYSSTAVMSWVTKTTVRSEPRIS